MRKKWMGLLLLVLILAGAILPSGHARALSFPIATIAADGVAFRKGASSKASLIQRLSIGTTVEVLETNINAEWHKVKYKGTTGYVNRVYVDFTDSLSAYSGSCTGTVVNCEKDVNIRSKPSTSGALVGKAKKGDTMPVLRQNAVSGWHEVTFAGRNAYIAAEYLQLSPMANDAQLSSLTVAGGTLYPAFSPDVYGYAVYADEDTVNVQAEANDGVKVSLDRTGKKSVEYKINSGNSKTIRISISGKTKYTIYLVRDVLTVGTWNIKRGYSKLEYQGQLVNDLTPDIMGIQEVYRKSAAEGVTDNLLSLRTRNMEYTQFSKSIAYPGGGEYGVGMLLAYKPLSTETIKLYSGEYEQRILQKVVVEINGKTISVYNTHLTYQSSAVRKKQFQQILQTMEQDKNAYKILLGDFNCAAEEFSVFKGYTVVNGPDTKYYDYNGNLIGKLDIDNIVVSKSITVLNSRMIPTTYSDHKPIVAYLTFD